MQERLAAIYDRYQEIMAEMLKPEVILEYCKHFNIDIEEVAFVDDRLDVLRKAEELGITAYHPSSFME